MTCLTLIKDSRSSLLCDRLVVPAMDLEPLQDAVELTVKLKDVLQNEHQRIHAAEREGYEKGYRRGREEGLQKALDDLSSKLSQLAELVEKRHLQQQSSVARIAIQVVRKIATEVGASEMVASLAETASQELTPSETLIIKVHPCMQATVAERMLETTREAARHLHLEVRGDDSLEPFDCVLTTEYGNIIAGLETQLNSLEAALSAGKEET